MDRLTMDHLVFASPDLDTGVAHVERLLGVSMESGGRHQGFGTWNRLLGFGPDRYMEVVAPDPAQPEPERPRWFGLDDLLAPRLVTWCAATSDLDGLVARAADAGLDLGEPRVGQRRREDGSVLRWRMTDPWADRAGGVIPFFIDWGDTPHPGGQLSASCSFLDLRAGHPEPERVTGWLSALGLDIPVREHHAPRLVARIESPNGTVELS